MFGSIGPTELILIFIIALLVFGPKKLPEIGKSVGKAIREFKKASDEIKGRIEEEIQASEFKDVHKDIKEGLGNIKDEFKGLAAASGVTDLKNEIRSIGDTSVAAPAHPGAPQPGTSTEGVALAAAEPGALPGDAASGSAGSSAPADATSGAAADSYAAAAAGDAGNSSSSATPSSEQGPTCEPARTGDTAIMPVSSDQSDNSDLYKDSGNS